MSTVPLIASASDIPRAIRAANRNPSVRVYVARRLASMGRVHQVPREWGLSVAPKFEASEALTAALEPLRAQGALALSEQLLAEAQRAGVAVQVGVRPEDGVVLYDLAPGAVVPPAITAAGWDPNLHPRDRKGRFIELFGLLSLFDGDGFSVPSLRAEAVGSSHRDNKDWISARALAPGKFNGKSVKKGDTVEVEARKVESAPAPKARLETPDGQLDYTPESVAVAPGDRVRIKETGGEFPVLEAKPDGSVLVGEEGERHLLSADEFDMVRRKERVEDRVETTTKPDTAASAKFGEGDVIRLQDGRTATVTGTDDEAGTVQANTADGEGVDIPAADVTMARRKRRESDTEKIEPSKIKEEGVKTITSPKVNLPGKDQDKLDAKSSEVLDKELRDSLAELGINPDAVGNDAPASGVDDAKLEKLEFEVENLLFERGLDTTNKQDPLGAIVQEEADKGNFDSESVADRVEQEVEIPTIADVDAGVPDGPDGDDPESDVDALYADTSNKVYAILEDRGVDYSQADDAVEEWISNDFDGGITDPEKIATRIEGGIDFGEPDEDGYDLGDGTGVSIEDELADGGDGIDYTQPVATADPADLSNDEAYRQYHAEVTKAAEANGATFEQIAQALEGGDGAEFGDEYATGENPADVGKAFASEIAQDAEMTPDFGADIPEPAANHGIDDNAGDDFGSNAPDNSREALGGLDMDIADAFVDNEHGLVSDSEARDKIAAVLQEKLDGGDDREGVLDAVRQFDSGAAVQIDDAYVDHSNGHINQDERDSIIAEALDSAMGKLELSGSKGERNTDEFGPDASNNPMPGDAPTFTPKVSEDAEIQGEFDKWADALRAEAPDQADTLINQLTSMAEKRNAGRTDWRASSPEAATKAAEDNWTPPISEERLALFPIGDPREYNFGGYEVWHTNPDGSKNGGRGAFPDRASAQAYVDRSNELNADFAKKQNGGGEDLLPESPEYLDYEGKVVSEMKNLGLTDDQVNDLVFGDGNTEPMFLDDARDGLDPENVARDFVSGLGTDVLPEPGNEPDASTGPIVPGPVGQPDVAPDAPSAPNFPEGGGDFVDEGDGDISYGGVMYSTDGNGNWVDDAGNPASDELRAALQERSGGPAPAAPSADSADAKAVRLSVTNSANNKGIELDPARVDAIFANSDHEQGHKDLAKIMTELKLGGKQRKRMRDLLDRHYGGDDSNSASVQAKETADNLAPDNPVKERLAAKAAGSKIGTDPSKSPPPGLTGEQKLANALEMYGADSGQYKQALRKWGPKGAPTPDSTPEAPKAAETPNVAPDAPSAPEFNGPDPQPGAKVYQHPMGARVYVNPDGSMEAYGKDGKKKKTSATPEKLAAGHGQWTEVGAPAAPAAKTPDYGTDAGRIDALQDVREGLSPGGTGGDDFKLATAVRYLGYNEDGASAADRKSNTDVALREIDEVLNFGSLTPDKRTQLKALRDRLAGKA